MTTPLLQARSITKRFGALQALADVDVDIHAGEVLAILGDNGAGKSTFIKILSGAYEPSAGTLLLDGAPARFASPQEAADVGIATIFQELALSENLSIAAVSSATLEWVCMFDPSQLRRDLRLAFRALSRRGERP